ncbi:hypothetical protein [Nocardia arizonensis]|uniref:hypothetical protein n=1 Tax=Nocardia arizonensis TaxID=1141647 RepID=UPI0006D2612F|nr:hypothetical protein [Nocardia arizonensis]
MASDPDSTIWASLHGLADEGYLELEPGTAEDCARHVEDMLDDVVGMQKWMMYNGVAGSPYISGSPSGANLALVFGHKFASELRTRLDRHREILVDMGNTFITAGKKYQRTEDSSTHSFEDINFHPEGTLPQGGPTKGAIPENPPKPDAVTKYDVPNDLLVPELGAQLSWEQLYEYCNLINPQAVADAAGVWQWISTSLDTSFTTLRTTISAAGNWWKGVGAKAAIGSTTQYAETSKQLTSDMRVLGNTLLYTSGWLQQTRQNALPPTPTPPVATTEEQQTANANDLLRFQQNYQTYFTTNYTHTSTRIVTLPTPDPVTVTALRAGESAGVPLGEPSTVDEDHTGEGPDIDSGNEDSTGDHDGGDLDGGDLDGGGGDGDHSGGGDDHTDGGNGQDPTESSPGPEWNATTPEGITGEDLSLLDNLPQNQSTETSHTPGIVASIPTTGVPLGNTVGGISSKGVGGGRGSVFTAPLGTQEAKLFPRATAPVDPRVITRAGPVGGPGGMPFGGAPGRSMSDEERERRRVEYLNSVEHLDEALGEHGRGIRPVLDR